jgi:hypothetical protein
VLATISSTMGSNAWGRVRRSENTLAGCKKMSTRRFMGLFCQTQAVEERSMSKSNSAEASLSTQRRVSIRRLVWGLALSVTLAACSGGLRRDGAEMQLKYTDYAGEPVEKILTMRGVDSWTPVSRNQLVIWTGINEAWLLTIWDNCPDLMFAQGVRVTQTGRSISRFDKVMVGRDSCPIRQIQPVDIKQMRSDRKAAKEAVPAP